MAKNETKPKKIDGRRNLPHAFKPGNSGGPGRPKGKKSIETMFREGLEILVKKGKEQGLDLSVDTIEGDIFASLISKARSGHMKATEIYLDRRFGKVATPVEVRDTRLLENVANEIESTQDEWFESVPQIEDVEAHEVEQKSLQNKENTTDNVDVVDALFEDDTDEVDLAELFKKS